MIYMILANMIDDNELFENCEKWTKHSIILSKEQTDRYGLDVTDGQIAKLIRYDRYQGTDTEETVLIMNIMYAHGLAPRIYRLDKLDGRTVIIMERLTGMGEMNGNDVKLEEICRRPEYEISMYSGDHDEIRYNDENWFSGKYVDFGGFRFKSREEYEKRLFERIDSVTHFGKAYEGRRASYQSIDSRKIDGKRKTSYRIEQMGLSRQEFRGKTVLDIGCNLGMFLHYAACRGASGCVGFDLPEIILVAHEFAGLEGRYDISFTTSLPTEHADIVFYLAMSKYLGFPEWLKSVTKEVLYYEGHANDSRENTERQLSRLFGTVEFLGMTTDRSERLLYKCMR
jgi:hypothetical protein